MVLVSDDDGDAGDDLGGEGIVGGETVMPSPPPSPSSSPTFDGG